MFEDRLLHKLGKSYVCWSPRANLGDLGEAQQPGTSVRKEGGKDGRIKRQRRPVDLLDFLECNTRQFFWDVQAPAEESITEYCWMSKEEGSSGATLRQALWTRKEGACQAAQSRMRPITAGNGLAVNITGIVLQYPRSNSYFQVSAV